MAELTRFTGTAIFLLPWSQGILDNSAEVAPEVEEVYTYLGYLRHLLLIPYPEATEFSPTRGTAKYYSTTSSLDSN